MRETRRRGFTLIELLVVVAILGLIAGVVGRNVYRAKVEADREIARVQLAELSKALDAYRIRFHRFPTTAEGLSALVQPSRGLAIIDEVPADPWDGELSYVCPGVRHPDRFDLASKGPDGLPDTEDDITSWGRERR